MIIKKKYTIPKQQEDKIIEQSPVLPAVEPQSVKSGENQAVPKKEEKTAVKPELPPKQNEEKVESEKKPVKAEEPEKKVVEKKSVVDDLDLSLDNINFEQRQERREGTRRRGYRRIQDRNIVSRAQEDALSIKEVAKQDGYKEGIENANKEIAELRGKFAEFYGYKDEIFNKVSDCIYDISIEIAKKILNKELETDKNSIISIIKKAVEEINPIENKIILKVMPKDVEIVKNKLPEIFSENGFEAAISVVPDKNIADGGVIVETSNGIIDATIQTQLAIMEKALCKNKEGSE